MGWLKGSAGRARHTDAEEDDANSDKQAPHLEVLETADEKRARWRSVYIIYFTMFQMSLGFSIVLTGVWPYLDKVRDLRAVRSHPSARLSTYC